MEKKKIKKIIKWCSLAPFIITIIGAFLESLQGYKFLESPISPADTFIILIIYGVAEFWWIYLIAIAGLVYAFIPSRRSDDSLEESDGSLRKKDDYKGLKIIRFIALIPYLLLVYIVVNNVIWGKGLEVGLKNVVGFVGDPNTKWLFLVALIIIIVTSIFIKKKDEE